MVGRNEAVIKHHPASAGGQTRMLAENVSTTGSTKVSVNPSKVPRSNIAEWPSCVNAVRAIMSRISENVVYDRRLWLARVSPMQIFPPEYFTALASAQSSMISLRIAESPPRRSSAARRSNTQPPAAPAVLAVSFPIQLGG